MRSRRLRRPSRRDHRTGRAAPSGAGGARRADWLVAVSHEQAADITRRVESSGEPGRGEHRCSIKKIRVGEEGDHSLARWDTCCVPPTVRHRSDCRSAIKVGAGPRPEAGIERDKGVITAAGGTGPPGDRPAPRGVDKPGSPQRVSALVAPCKGHAPTPAVGDRPNKSGRDHFGAAIAGRGAEGGVEPVAVEVPAVTVRVEDEICRDRLVGAPDGHVAVTGKMAIGKDAIQDPEIT